MAFEALPENRKVMMLRHLRSLVVAYDHLSEEMRRDLTTALEIIKNREVLNMVRVRTRSIRSKASLVTSSSAFTTSMTPFEFLFALARSTAPSQQNYEYVILTLCFNRIGTNPLHKRMCTYVRLCHTLRDTTSGQVYGQLIYFEAGEGFLPLESGCARG